MELTREQQVAVDHDARRLAILGEPATGKTATLLARYRRLVERHVASRVLVLCASRATADRFVAALLPHGGQGFDFLPVTTAYGLAYDLVIRSGHEVRLAGAAERRVVIGRLLATEDATAWPVLGRFLGRPGFVAEVAAAVDAATEAGLDVAEAAAPPWPELARFARRHRAVLDGMGRLDPAGLADEAAALAAAQRHRFDHVLVDDAHTLAPSAARLVAALAGADDGLALTIAAEHPAIVGDAVEACLTQPFRVLAPGRLVRCEHPSLEAEAVAAELLRHHREGVAWSQMAVLVRHLAHRAPSIGRALGRHGIPVVPVPDLAPTEPVVRAVIDLLRWVDGDDAMLDRLLASPLARLDPVTVRRIRRDTRVAPGWSAEAEPLLAHLIALRDHLRAQAAARDTPADLAYEAWSTGLAPVGTTPLGAVDDRALDGLVSFIEGLSAYGDRHPAASLADTLAAIDEGELTPAPWRAAASAGTEGVSITSIAATRGREWHTVVVAGSVEGELPRACGGSPLFDVAAIGAEPPSLVHERRLFALATSRATASLVATAAPAPGVLLSRFFEAWPAEGARFLDAPGQPAPARPVTANETPIAPERQLVLSASQLATYDDCPLRYAYQYVLRAKEEPGVHASLGILTHKVLADFCDPDRPEPAPRSLDGLLQVAATHWSDDVARYRPQVEEVRRDLVAMLTAWWEQEGVLTPDVLAVERRFDIEVGPHRLVGSIDRVDRAGGGGLAVIDYKTGKHPPPPHEVVDDLQLAVYHLAATRDEGLAALGTPTVLQLRYLRTMNVFQQPVTDDHAERTEARVLAVADRILAEDFEPSVDASCRTCPFHRLCPLQLEGRTA